MIGDNSETKYRNEDQEYLQLNFHLPKTIESIEAWLEEEPTQPLFLAGQRGVGRHYLLLATSYQKQLANKPFSVIPLNLTGQDAESVEQLVKFQLGERGIKDPQQRQSWVKTITESFDIEIGDLFNIANLTLVLVECPVLIVY